MSDKSEYRNESDDSGFDCGSPVESGEDEDLSHRSRKCPSGCHWSFSATFVVLNPADQPSLSSDEVASKSAELFKDVFLDCDEAKHYLGRHFVKYMIVLFERSSTRRPASYDDNGRQYRIPVRGYLECTRTTISNLYRWMPRGLIQDVEWSAIPCQLPAHRPYLDDMSQISDVRQPWGKLLRGGRNENPSNNGRVWAFTGRMKCDIGSNADDRVDLTKIQDCFRAKYMPDDSKGPRQIKKMLILCNALNLMESSGGTTSIEVRGYIQSEFANLSVWSAWLPIGDFEWRRVQGRLHHDPQFQADTSDLSPSADAGSSNRAANPWILLLSEGEGDLLKPAKNASSSRGAKKVSSDSRFLPC